MSGRAYEVVNIDSAGCFHDQAKADLVKGAKHHDEAGIFIRQLHGIITFAADGVLDGRASLEDSEHMTYFEAFAGAEVNGHHIELANLADAVNH